MAHSSGNNKKFRHKRPKKIPTVIPEVINRSDITPASLEVLQHFGMDAPNLLNNYCCALEDSLIQTVQRCSQLLAANKNLEAQLKEHEVTKPKSQET